MDIFEILRNIYILMTIISILGILLSDKNSSAVTSWILTIIVFPMIGPLLYFTIGIDWRKRKRIASMQKNHKNIIVNMLNNNLVKYDLTKYLGENEDINSFHNIEINENINEKYLPISKMINSSDNIEVTNNESFKLYHHGKEAFEALLDDLRLATKTIDMEFFIWKSDNIGNIIKNILIDKAKQGVKIRLIFDGVGSFMTISKEYKEELTTYGIEFKYFLDLRWNLNKFNYRNHRKIAIIDHKVLHTGGMNIGDEYINGGKFKYWRDNSIRIVGEQVYYYLGAFIADWMNSGGKYDIENIKINKYQPNYCMQMTLSGPDSLWPSIKNTFNMMISLAKKDILIQSPYFIPDEVMLETLEIAALSGTNVKIMLTGIPDKKIPYWVAETYFERLLLSGVEIYRYKKGFMHNKNIIVDDEVSMLGTCNFDSRSFDVNYEINTIFYSTEISKNMSKQFYLDLEECEKITIEYIENKSIFTRMKNSVLRLFSPLL